MSNTILDHIHCFVRWKKNFGEMQWKCDSPDCYEVKPQSLIEGKRSICAICHENEIILTKEHLKRKRPRCEDCSRTQVALERRRIKSVLERLLNVAEQNQEPKQ